MRAPPVVPVVRHGRGRERRHVLQPGDRGQGGLLGHQAAVRAGHAGPAAHRAHAAQLPQRPQGGQGARATGLGAQQRAAQVPVRQNGREPDQLPGYGGVHGRCRQRYGL